MTSVKDFSETMEIGLKVTAEQFLKGLEQSFFETVIFEKRTKDGKLFTCIPSFLRLSSYFFLTDFLFSMIFQASVRYSLYHTYLLHHEQSWVQIIPSHLRQHGQSQG